MTNRQIAAKMVANGLIDLKYKLKVTSCSDVAKAGDKHHTSQAAADKVRLMAEKFIDPWIARMVKSYTPRAEKGKDKVVEQVDQVDKVAEEPTPAF